MPTQPLLLFAHRPLTTPFLVIAVAAALIWAPAVTTSAQDPDKPAASEQQKPAEAKTKEAENQTEAKKAEQEKQPEQKEPTPEKKPEEKQKPEKQPDEKKQDQPEPAEQKAEQKDEPKPDEKKEEPAKPQSIFPDKALEEAVRAEVFEKRYNQEPITAEDVKNISRVVGKGKGIKSLEGL